MIESRRWTGVLGLALLLPFTGSIQGCNSSEAAKRQIEEDWIHDIGDSKTSPESPPTAPPVEVPKEPPVLPTPKASPSVLPTSLPSPVPSPTSTVTPVPLPSPGVPTSQLYSGDAALAKYVQKFVDDAAKQGVALTAGMKANPVKIKIGSLDYLGAWVIGLCETGYGSRTVTFDPDFWNSVSETQRELLAHHELGHCILYRPHLTTLLSNGAEKSIMYPYIMSSSTYLNNYDYYQQELFSGYGARSSLFESPDPSEEVTQHVCDLSELGGA